MLTLIDKQSHGLTAAAPTEESAYSLEAQVGHTPLLHLAHTAVAAGLPDSVQIYAKAEWFNPSGSVKDRAALHIIRTAEEQGQLWPGMTLLDSSSGNMALAYAVLGRARGYKIKLALPENATPARIAILRAYGVDLTFTPATEGSDGALREARRLAAANSHFYYARQYDNPANWQAYYETMGPEIWAQTQGQITHFIAGIGSSGTFIGAARRLHELNPTISCLSLQPQTAKEGIKGLKHMATAVPPYIYDATVADGNLTVCRGEADAAAALLMQHEGLFVGPSAAAAVAATIAVARTLQSGVLVTVLPDDGSKYLGD